MKSVGGVVRELTLDECARAIGVANLGHVAQRTLTLPFRPVAAKLGRNLERFDADLRQQPLAVAASHALSRFGVELRGGPLSVPPKGPLLVLSNHPGAYDALALFASIPREDLRILAAERPFLRAMPALSEHLVFVPDATAPDDNAARGTGLRALIRHLRQGGCAVHFGAGQIEPDPAFHPPETAIGRWHDGAGALALAAQRAGGQVVVAVVAGVHSPRARQSLLVRAAEARGVTTLSLLLQLALPYYANVEVRVKAALVDESLPANRGAVTRHLEEVARDVASRA
jgi:hypothetical protein